MMTLPKGFLPAALVMFTAGCGEDLVRPPVETPPPPPPAPVLTIISGNDQIGILGEFLAQPLVVRVSDTKGTGVSNVWVTWQVFTGSGVFGVTAGVTPTGPDGVASISFRPPR